MPEAIPHSLFIDGGKSWTRREILQQPSTLRATQAQLINNRSAINEFVTPLLARTDLRIVFTGAGTSAFIGQCLAPWLAKVTGRRVEAIPTTDIVSAPDFYCEADTPTLLVSFGRSGNSPESVAAVEIANYRIKDIHHLVITCNADGALGSKGGENCYAIVLPDEVHDRSFAMTSSFSAMMMAAASTLSGILEMDRRIGDICGAVESVISTSDAVMADLAQRDFKRVVYLGSGLFQGLAREAALKLLELTDGDLVTAFDSPMGFRHGPKTIIDRHTLIVLFVSNDPYTSRYDLDLLAELRRDAVAGEIVALAADEAEGIDLTVPELDGGSDMELLFPYIIPAQLFALHASLSRGLTPDQPNAAGTVNRVVKGVTIYPLPA